MKIGNIKLMSGVLAMTLVAGTLTGCMDEIEVTQVATEGQVSGSTTATEALVQAMPASFNSVDNGLLNTNNWHGAFGYGSQMYQRDLMTGDLALVGDYSSHFNSFSRNQNLGEDYIFAGYVWSYYYGFILTANNVISGVDPETATSAQLG